MTMENCHHFCYKTSLTAVLEFNNFEHNLSFYGKMAAIMFMQIYQNCSTYIFNKSISQNLQLLRNNGNNIRYCWIIFTMSPSFLYKQLYNRKLKVLFIILSFIQFTIAFHTLNVVCHSKPSLNTNLRNSPTKEFFLIYVLHITYKINELLADMHFKLFTISKIKNKYLYHLYLKIILLLSGVIELNPGLLNRHQIKKEDFEGFITKNSISCIYISTVFLMK